MNANEYRRSQRVLLDVPLIVTGESPEREAFQEETFTLAVSAHGALLILAARVAEGQTVQLENPETHQQREARVAYLGSRYAGLRKVGIEFTRPAPDFWPVTPPPPDWTAAP